MRTNFSGSKQMGAVTIAKRTCAVKQPVGQGYMEGMELVKCRILRRHMQLASLVSLFPWPIRVEAFGEHECSSQGFADSVLMEYDMYMRGAC